MIRFYAFSLVILFSLICLLQIKPSYAAKVGFDVNYAKQLGSKMPSKADAASVLDQPIDTRKLERHNDASLLNSGSHELSSEMGQLLTGSEAIRDEAKSEHKIDSSNKSLNDSIKLSHNPQSEVGETPTISESSSETTITKTCIEGVEFDTDIITNLVYDCREEEYGGPIHKESKMLKLSHEKMVEIFAHDSTPNAWVMINRLGDRSRKRMADYIGIAADKIDRALDVYKTDNSPWLPANMRGQRKYTASFRAAPGVIDYEIYYNIISQEKFKRLKELGEYWQLSNTASEDIVTSNQCYETSRRCLQSGTRTFFGKYPVSRPCWQEKVNYRCQSEPIDGCQHLENQKCSLKESECLKSAGDRCLKYKRTYACRGGKRRQMQYGSLNYGVDFPQPAIEPNNNLGNVAYLAALNEANKDCVKQSNGMCRNPLTIFPGERIDCKYIIAGCINCCTKMKGWGKKIGLSKCSGEEKGLALKRERQLCHKVGKYCSKKYLGRCVIKKTSFCCFNSKLARVFHEQGRSQLGISWGSAKYPNCGPLTLEQLARVDFSKFDMEQLFDALLNKGKENANKKMPIPKKGQVPAAQAEQYKSGRGQRQGGL